ncbi:dihydrofolate reductase [Hymenobacter roseosalivarius DSM 11622]|uniref:Dihydrofolate reductase n=1 Tax=Hymenobacter roseosalivarius DSM 11622 TaxID=645990 RepID=A0A1W1VXV3_9BACT|nr:dihydrofolate reductase [Hymenobacter roseosalivarius]SMB98219.1 dihydrofolate reductase [Hymenobacter roseosalivarius DSM 11622]
MIALVVAVAQNGIIGRDNQLIWHLPKDLKHFKNLTLGHPIIMGRRTFEAIGRPLPGRQNIVVTRQPEWKADGTETTYSVPEALELAQTHDENIFIIGGAEIYRQSLSAADTIYLTEIHHDFEGDATFPDLNHTEWREETRVRHEPDEKHAYPFSFVTLRRR